MLKALIIIIISVHRNVELGLTDCDHSEDVTVRCVGKCTKHIHVCTLYQHHGERMIYLMIPLQISMSVLRSLLLFAAIIVLIP